MMQPLKLDRTCGFAGCRRRSGHRAGEDQDRRDRDAVRPCRRARPAGPRRLSTRGQGSRRQDGRQGRRSRRRRRRTQAGRRRDQGKGLLEREKVDFVVGPIFSNILQAIHRPVTENKTFLISPNAGPSSYAGKECSPFFYVTSYQNDQVHEILGKVAQDRGYKRVYVLVPNYQAGKDSAAGFKIDYKGEIVEESYMPLGTWISRSS